MAKAKELTQVVDAIEADLVELLKSAREEMLSKVHPGEDTESEPPADESATSPDGPPASPSPSPAGPPADASAGGPPPPDAGSPPAPGGDPAMDGGAPGGDAPPSQDELVQAYAALPPDQLEAHFMAIQAVMSQKMGGAPGGDMGSPPAGSPSPAPGPEAMKAEVQKASDLLAKAETAMRSRDSEITRLTAEVERLSKMEIELSKATEQVATFLRAPNRLAVTTATETAPAGDPLASLSKSEITERLRKACRSNISAADRKAIDQYVCSGTGLDKVKHLIVGAA